LRDKEPNSLGRINSQRGLVREIILAGVPMHSFDHFHRTPRHRLGDVTRIHQGSIDDEPSLHLELLQRRSSGQSFTV
jgi:hypothetical protein